MKRGASAAAAPQNDTSSGEDSDGNAPQKSKRGRKPKTSSEGNPSLALKRLTHNLQEQKRAREVSMTVGKLENLLKVCGAAWRCGVIRTVVFYNVSLVRGVCARTGGAHSSRARALGGQRYRGCFGPSVMGVPLGQAWPFAAAGTTSALHQ